MAEPSNSAPPATSYDEPYRYASDERLKSFEHEDQRKRAQWIDWLILAAMIALSLGYHGIIFLLQPGLR